MGRDTSDQEYKRNPEGRPTGVLGRTNGDRQTVVSRRLRILRKQGAGRGSPHTKTKRPRQIHWPREAGVGEENGGAETQNLSPVPKVSCGPACRKAADAINDQSHEEDRTREPCAMKVACTVRRG